MLPDRTRTTTTNTAPSSPRATTALRIPLVLWHTFRLCRPDRPRPHAKDTCVVEITTPRHDRVQTTEYFRAVHAKMKEELHRFGAADHTRYREPELICCLGARGVIALRRCEVLKSQRIIARECDFCGTSASTRQVLNALKYVQSMGVAHRDVKPANITATGIVQLIDFGIARTCFSGHLTQFSQTQGSIHFMSPEHILGDRGPDARSGVYSVGGTPYEIFTHKRPFDRGSGVAIMAAHKNQAFVRLLEGKPTLRELILKALEKDPCERFWAAELLVALAAALASSRPAPPWARVRGFRPVRCGSQRTRRSASRGVVELRRGARAERLSWGPAHRWAHSHVIGSSGSGKSIFLEAVLRLDLRAGHGFCLLDPHGTLYDDIAASCAHNLGQPREPYFLIMDEFQSFVALDIADMPDQFRKFGLFLTLAHQRFGQFDDNVVDDVLTNCRIKVLVGGLPATSARLIAEELFIGKRDPRKENAARSRTKCGPLDESNGLGSCSARSIDRSRSSCTGSSSGFSGAMSFGRSYYPVPMWSIVSNGCTPSGVSTSGSRSRGVAFARAGGQRGNRSSLVRADIAWRPELVSSRRTAAPFPP